MMETKTAAFSFDLVREQMQLVERAMRQGPGGHNPYLGAALDHILSSGGKRIRPTIVLLAGGLVGSDPERTVYLAAAVEMLHTATLVHDDLIDGSLLRRGIPTLNARSSPGATVLTGDYVFARAAELVSRTDSLRLMSRFAETLMTIVNGEITQLFEQRRNDARRDYFDRIYSKTASLFELAAGGPPMMRPMDEKTIDALETYGYNLGIAFQIVDDVLDFTGDQERVGKPVASDLRQGLITLPAICYLDQRRADKRLQIILNGGNLGEKDLHQLVQAIRDSGAIERAMEEAAEFACSAARPLQAFPESGERRALLELAEYVVQRSS
jgi:geranylgeranyl pyrophosphate synthase